MNFALPQVLAFRVQRHGLAERAARSRILEVASKTCGLHAQLMSSAELSLHARVEDLKPGDLRDQLWKKRVLIKTWAMRGTLHLLPAREYGLWQRALSTYGHFLKPSWLRWCGLTLPELERIIAAIGEVLDEATLTRVELAREVSRHTRSRLGEKLLGSWGMTLKPAAYQGLLCFAESRGANSCFTRPPQQEAALEPHAAAAEIARRFLALSGPVTREQYARWWGAQAAPAQRILDSLDDAVRVQFEGKPAWMLARDVAELKRAGPQRIVRLLPAFDQYVISAPRSALAEKLRPLVYRAQGWISPVILVDGRIEGVWRHDPKRRRIQLEPFVKLPQWARAQAQRESERLLSFLQQRGAQRLPEADRDPPA